MVNTKTSPVKPLQFLCHVIYLTHYSKNAHLSLAVKGLYLASKNVIISTEFRMPMLKAEFPTVVTRPTSPTITLFKKCVLLPACQKNSDYFYVFAWSWFSEQQTLDAMKIRNNPLSPPKLFSILIVRVTWNHFVPFWV